MGIPQVIMIVIMAIALLFSIVKHGKTESRRINCVSTAISIAIHAVILYFGGFWN